MAYVWKHPKSSFWMGVYRDEKNVWRKRSTKKTARTTALALSLEWERAAQMARDGVLTEAVCRDVLGGLLERTTGEKMRQSTVREFCEEWLKGKTNARQEATATRYGGSVSRFLTLCANKADKPIAAITAQDIQRFYDSLIEEGLAPATLRVEMKTVSSVFNSARRLGLIAINPVAAIELPDRIKQVKRFVFTHAQVQMLLRAAEPEWQTAILLGYFAGLRLGDSVTLEWGSVDLVNQKLVVEVRKTAEVLELPMHPSLEAHLTKLAGDSTGPICPNLAAVPVGGRSGLSKQFLAIMRKAGISNDSVATGGQRQLSRLSFHALRASFNSVLHNKGVDQEIRRKLTGHKSDSVNDRYTQTQIATLRDAVCKIPMLNL